MAVMKPQKALEVNGQEIYPLSHADQIVMPDGKRLSETSESMVTCDLEGSVEDSSTVPVNADTLGGFAASEYAKANNTARRISETIKKEDLNSYVRAVRDGNVVSYHVSSDWYNAGRTLSISAYQTLELAQLSKEFWPHSPMHCVPGVDSSGTSSQPHIRIYIGNDGVVSIISRSGTTISNIQGIYGTFTFAARYTIEELEEVTT